MQRAEIYHGGTVRSMERWKLEIYIPLCLLAFWLQVLAPPTAAQEIKRQAIPVGMFNVYASSDANNLSLALPDLREAWQGVPTNWEGGYYPYEACNLVQHYWPKNLPADIPPGADASVVWWQRFLQEVYDQGNENGEVRLRAIVGPLFNHFEVFGEGWLTNFIQELSAWESSGAQDGVIAGWYLVEEPMGSTHNFSPDIFEEMVKVIDQAEAAGGFRRHERYVDVSIDGAFFTPQKLARFCRPADVVMISASSYLWMARGAQPVFDPRYRDLAFVMNQVRSIILPDRDARGLPHPRMHLVLQAYDPIGFGQPTHWEMRQQIREALTPDSELLGNRSVAPADGIWFFWWPGLTFENEDRVDDWLYGRRLAEAIELEVAEVTGNGGEATSPNVPTTSRFAFSSSPSFNPDDGIIPYELAQSGRVEIEILDVDGSRVEAFNMGVQSVGRLHRFGGPRWRPSATEPDGRYIFRLFLNSVLVESVEVEVQRRAQLFSPSHAPGVWSNDNTIEVVWRPPAFSAGLRGFSALWSDSPASIPPRTVTMESSNRMLTSIPLPDGNSHYFHLRSVNGDGVWSVASHLGPFWIDATPPTLSADLASSSHEVSVWSATNRIDISWSAVDAETTQASPPRGYSILWDHQPFTLPTAEINAGNAVTALSTPPLVDGVWYLHLRAADVAGNWTEAAAHLGPFQIDTHPPHPPSNLTSASHEVGIWSNQASVDLEWRAASDQTSGIVDYRIVWDTSPSASLNPDFSLSHMLRHNTPSDEIVVYRSPPLPEGDSHYVHIRTTDLAGLPADEILDLGPFRIDTTPPGDVRDFSAFPAETLEGTPLEPSQWLTSPQVSFTWQPSTDSGSGVVRYEITQLNLDTDQKQTVQIHADSPPRWTPMNLGDGEWRFRVRAADDAGNSGPYTELSLKLDTTVSTPAIHSPSHPDSESWYANPSPVIEWTIAEDLSGIANYFGEWAHQPNTIPQTFIDTESSVSTLEDGIWYFHLRAIDNAGNLSEAVHYRVRIDASAPDTPRIASSSHPAGVWRARSDVDLRWNVGGGPSGIAGYSSVLDRQRTTLPDDQINSLQPELTTTLADGIWYFHVRTQSNTGLWSETVHHEIRIDTEPPAIAIEAPRGKAWIREAVSAYSGTMRDDLSGIDDATLEYRYGGLHWMPFASEASEGWLDTDELPHVTDADGVPLQVRVRDRAGNVGFSEEIAVRVDLESPSLTVTSPTHPQQEIWYADPQPVVEWTVSSDLSGIANYFWVWDNQPDTVPEPSVADNVNGGLIRHSTRGVRESPLRDGIWYFHLIALDRAGNASDPAHYRFQIDTEPPTATIRIFRPEVIDGRPRSIRYREAKAVPPRVSSGEIRIALEFSEETVETPKLFLLPNGAGEIALELVAESDASNPPVLQWRTMLQVSPKIGDGEAKFRFVGVDRAGNPGGSITAGGELIIDTLIEADETKAQYRIGDDDTIVTIPSRALRSDIRLHLERLPAEAGGYRLIAWNSTGRALPDGTFARPIELQLPLHSIPPITSADSAYTVLYNDGVRTHRVRTETTGGHVIAQVSQVGEFRIASAPALKRKIAGGWAAPNPFTPNNSGDASDRTIFHVQTREGDVTFTVEIYDLTGRRVRTLRHGVNVWDGTDENGVVVEGGVYIYQIHAEDEVVSGTVVVVR
ncbi:MAG: Ig-like domain repeat protein [Candidatus Poribacteria bacterium]|nr:Ig-like domain repeat protein [Candidatus Poribacteria bacterium]